MLILLFARGGGRIIALTGREEAPGGDPGGDELAIALLMLLVATKRSFRDG